MIRHLLSDSQKPKCDVFHCLTRAASSKLVKHHNLWFDGIIKSGSHPKFPLVKKGMDMNDGTPSAAAGLIERAKAIILNPSETWPVIATEQTTPGDLITRYALPLAAIGPIATFIGGQIFGISLFLVTVHPSLMSGLTMALTSFVTSLVAVVIVALAADFFAPKFGGEANRTNAFKLVVYAMTPGWVAGILGIIPALAMLSILAGLYGIFLLYQGSTPLMKVPRDKAPVFTAAVVVSAIVLSFIAAAVTSSVTRAMGMGAASMASASANDSVELNIPGVGKIDTAKMEQAGKQMEAAANGQITTVQPDQLKALLPATLGGYARTAVEANAMGQMGAEAEGTYTNGDKSIRLKVIDSAGLGALAGLGSAMGAQHSREDANGYERANTVNGQMQIEKWDNKASRGEFTQQVGGRFMITAEGEAGSIDELKAAVAAIDQGQLAGLAK